MIQDIMKRPFCKKSEKVRSDFIKTILKVSRDV